jgi:hypothetical protein
MVVMFACAGMSASGCMSAASDPVPCRSVHVRGTVQTLAGSLLTVATATGSVPLQVLPLSRVSVVIASDRGHLKDGGYLGITSIIQPDGSLRALEVHIFPAGTPRSGEGSYASDLSGLDGGGSKMTNGTTSHAAALTESAYAGMEARNGVGSETPGNFGRRREGTSLTLQFRGDGGNSSQTPTIPWGVPIVRFEAGCARDLKPGAHVLVIATTKVDGGLCVDRILVGRNSLVPSL